MTEPAGALAARIERFEQAADPALIWEPAALSEAEQAMRACTGDRSDAATWRLIGMLHLARYRLDQQTTQDAAVAGAFFAAVAVADPGRLPEKLRGSNVPPGESAGTWAGLVEEMLGHVDPATYPHVGLLIHALVRRAMAHPGLEVSERLMRLLLQESMRSADPSWAPGALGLVGAGLVRLYAMTGEKGVIGDAVHVLLRAALGDAAHVPDLAAALGSAAPDDEELVRAYVAAAEAPPRSRSRSQALLALVDVTHARAAASYADGDLLAFIRAGQCALDFWHEQWAHPGVVAPYASGLIEWYVVTGDERSLEAATEMLEALRVAPDESARGLGADPLARLALLGKRRWRRYLVTGDLADLDDAVSVLRQAARHAPAGHPDRARHLTTLANALLRRAVATGGDPAEPVAAARAALAALGAQDPARAGTLLLLGRALRLGLTQETADEAVAALREALSVGEAAGFRAEAYGLVSEVLCWRATRVEGDRRAEDLREAVLSARQGVELAQKAAHGQAGAQRTLCKALLARYTAHRDARDLTEALTLAGEGDAALLSEALTLAGVGDAALFSEAPAVAGGDEPAPPLRPEVPHGVDEQLARAATELALRLPDEEVALRLLVVAERGAAEPGEFLLEVAQRLTGSGRHRTAARVLERAVRAFESAGSPARAAHALSALGAVHEDLAADHTAPGSGRPAAEGYAQALAAYGRSAALYRSLPDPRSEALQLGNLGRVHLRAGDPARAAEHHLRAAALCEAAGLPAEEAAQQGHSAEAYLALRDPDSAVACAARARELHQQAGDRRAAALALVPAARAAVDQDDLTAANERMAACAIELEAAGEWEQACGALDAHAVTLAERGHRGHAAACETRLVEIVRRRGQRREPADEWYRIGRRRRSRGDTGGAGMAFELAGREYEAIGHHDGAASVRYNLGVLAYAEGEQEAALEAFGAAAKAFERLRAPAKEAVALVMRASCLTALDRVEDALADLDRASDLAAAEGDLDALFTATLGRAAADVRLGEPREAEERLYSALGLAAGDALKEAVVRDRLAALAARDGDLRAQAEALEAALDGFRASGRDRLTALASLKLGLVLEARGEFRRARARLEEGLAGLAAALDLRPSEAPFEVVAAMAGGLDAELLSRLAALQLTLGDLTRGRATLAQAVATLDAEGRGGEFLAHLELRLRLEEAEAAGDLTTARTLAEEALGVEAPGVGDLGAKGSGAEDVGVEDVGVEDVGVEDVGVEDVGVEDVGAEHVGVEDVGVEARDRSYLLAKLSGCCRELGDLAAAHEYAARGYELRDERVIEHLCNLGAAATAMGRAEEAAGHLTKAVELARDADSALPAQLVQSLVLLGAALTDLGRAQEAERVYAEGLAHIEAPIWRALRAPLLSGLADLHLRLGHLDEAATRFREAIAIGEELGRRAGLATAYADLALVHELRGEPTEAVPLLERALDLEPAPGRGTVLALLALARLGAPERLAEALALAQDLGYLPGEAIAHLHLGAFTLTTTGPATGSATDSATGPATGLVGPNLATASHDRAHHHLSTAIDLLTDLGHDQALATAYHHRSIAEEGLEDLPAALADAERACALGHEPSRDRAIRLAARLNLGMTAWTHAEQAKLNTLTPEPSAHLEAVRTLTTIARNTRDPERAASILRRARAAQTELEASWRPTTPGHLALHRGKPPTRAQLDTLVSVPEHAEGARGLLGFHLGEGTVTVLAHRTGWPEPRAFPTSVGHDLLTEFRRTVDGGRPGLLDIEARRHRADLWRRLADLLLSDALDALGNGIGLLHLIPHPALRQIPLHALSPSGRLLIERFPVAYAPSATALTRLTRRPRTPADGSLVLGFGSGPAAEAEAREAAARLGTRPHLAREATSALLPGSWNVLHLACPAVYDHADPFGSGLRLADGLLTARRLMSMNVTADVALLTGHEPPAEPAASSSPASPAPCMPAQPGAPAEPGAPAQPGAPAGDGVAALSAALLHAGVRSALLTLWPVSPEITAALARDIHTRLSSGSTSATAFRAAVLALRDLYGSAEPDLWASYAPVGLLTGSPPAHGEPGTSVTSTR
ncbi:CHAT domain-containing protein [Nonomuraea rubra]|uniref:Tetratricopeptide (TPR) repeat protein n=1 Tax=Nonomuraea rubra TaxID=46180 RepID=A0A7X0TYV3_9ACTN|nr:CHAT domain-containing protein [Nonomuraea rubra]MBB6548624.1 tetratricopeptide (TPR) repeat protein [Nonomuraea rubra]